MIVALGSNLFEQVDRDAQRGYRTIPYCECDDSGCLAKVIITY